MMPVIRVDDQVYAALKQRAVELDLVFAGPNDVLRHDYRSYLGKSEETGKERVESEVVRPPENAIEIELKNVEAHRKHRLIPVPRSKRRFFPGYKERFILATGTSIVTTRVTSAPKGTPIGDPDAGAYIQGNLRDWYDSHPELQSGQKIRFEAIEPGKKYKLTVLNT